ncbi:unnamed protein product [Durusdinium trenchii]|uniref:Uncharacterized protein n=1 Tax=Durusdinium trenchii TaxID=1381693 RepID=A0ABP0QDJ5_9DINO
MGLRFSECSANSQHVKDCCHLEGETPIEIRIAFSQQRPAAYPSHESHQGTAPRALRFPTHAASAARVPGKPNRARTSSKPCADDLDEFDAESFTVPDTERSQRGEDPAILAVLQNAWAQEVEHFPEVIRANRGKTVGATQAQDLLPQIAAADLGAGSGSTDSGACGLTSPEKEARAADLASTTQACLTQGIEP